MKFMWWNLDKFRFIIEHLQVEIQTTFWKNLDKFRAPGSLMGGVWKKVNILFWYIVIKEKYEQINQTYYYQSRKELAKATTHHVTREQMCRKNI